MFDIALRRLKDDLVDPLAALVPRFISPDILTLLAFGCGLESCNYARLNQPGHALFFWALNRVLDCLDGAVARRRNIASPRGGFLDLLSDFIIYSLIPLSIAIRGPSLRETELLAVAILESTFHVNNFILFYSAAVAAQRDDKELTSVTMRPALIEGFESGIFFTLMFAKPEWLEPLSWVMAAGVGVGIIQRTYGVCSALGKQATQPNIEKTVCQQRNSRTPPRSRGKR